MLSLCHEMELRKLESSRYAYRYSVSDTFLHRVGKMLTQILGKLLLPLFLGILTVSLTLKWCLIQFHLLFSSPVLMWKNNKWYIMHWSRGSAWVCICAFSRKPQYLFPSFKHIPWTGLRSLNNKAPTENMHWLLELQYAFSFCKRRGKLDPEFFSPCNTFVFLLFWQLWQQRR